MRANFIRYLSGYLRIAVRGQHTEVFLNEAVAGRYTIWDIHQREPEKLELCILLKDFFRLRPLLKQTGCRMHLLQRFGFPFLLDKLEHRKWFVIGCVGFIIGLYLLSSLVWQVNVTGNERIDTEQILQAAYGQGLRPLQWKFKLKDPDELAKRLQSLLPGTAWVGVELKGTHANIKIVESDLPEQRPLMSPRNLVASTDAIISKIIAEKGKAVVQLNAHVHKGDMLISGTLGEGEFTQYVVAQGEVRGLVWHEYELTIPLVQKYKVYTGESFDRSYLVLGQRGLKTSGYGKIPYEFYEIEESRKTLHWRNIALPLGWMTEKVREVKYAERKLTVDEAKQAGLTQAQADALHKAGASGAVKDVKILHEQVNNGKVYLKVLLEVDEDIAQEQPIVSPG